MKVIAMTNKKGGVGKTTTALATAACLGQSGFSVLAIDMDPQMNFSLASGADLSQAGTFEFLNGEPIESCVQKCPKYKLLAANRGLSRAEKEFDQFGREHLLEKALGRAKGYDYIILDTAPAMNVLTLNALTVADAVVVCCQTDAFSLEGLDDIVTNINLAKQYYNPRLAIAGILLTRYNVRTKISEQAMDEFRGKAKDYGTRVFATPIRENVAIKESQMRKIDIFSYNSTCNASEDYAAFTKELFNIVEGGKKEWPENLPKPSANDSPRISIPRQPRKRPPARRR